MLRWLAVSRWLAALAVMVGLGLSIPAFGSTASAAKPKSGGTLTFAVAVTLAPTLDPAKLLGGGTVGANELGTIYDSLVNYDIPAKKYVMGTLQSLTSAQNFTVWTLKIKPGIKFTDGTPYDAAAVAFNLNRDIASTSTISDKALMVYFIKSVTVVDNLTLTVNMNASWSAFPFVLSDNAGKIVSPTQVQALGSSFGTVPCQCGAGPFMVKSFSPTGLDVVRNPNYYGKKAYLDGINFVIPPSDPSLALEQVKAGAFTTAFIQDPATDKTALSEKSDFNISAVYQWSGSSLQYNDFSGPTTNPLVRKALSLAVNPAVVNERCYSGALTLSSAIVGKTSAYKISVPGIKYNLAQAKATLAQAKAGGYDGQIKLTTGNDTVSACESTVISAMYAAAGFTVTTNEIPTSTITAAVLVSKSYQVATWGLSYDDSFLFFRMFQSFTSFGDRYGYTSPGMDEALTTMRMTNNPAALTTAITEMQKVLNEDNPFLNISEGDKFLISSPKVHGFVPTSDACWLFGGVWMS